MDEEILAKIKEFVGNLIEQAVTTRDDEDMDLIDKYLALCIIQRLDTIDESLVAIYRQLNDVEAAINRG
jgi:hypothetical protein